jgi:hypothetical protein
VSSYVHEAIPVRCNFVIVELGAIMAHNSFSVSSCEDFTFKIKDEIKLTLNILPPGVPKVC